MQVICPLEVWVSSNKKFILNLNNYRNTHFRVLTKAKKEYSALLAPQLRNKQCFDKVKLHMPYILEQPEFWTCRIPVV